MNALAITPYEAGLSVLQDEQEFFGKKARARRKARREARRAHQLEKIETRAQNGGGFLDKAAGLLGGIFGGGQPAPPMEMQVPGINPAIPNSDPPQDPDKGNTNMILIAVGVVAVIVVVYFTMKKK